MGFESPMFVMDILKKRRPIKLKYGEMLASGLGFEGAEKTFFKTLIQCEKTNDEDKSYLLEVLAALRPRDTFVDKEKGIFSHWLNMVIFTMSQMREAPLTADFVKNSLKTDVSFKTIEDCLNLLVDHGLLERNDLGQYKNKVSDFVTSANDVSIPTIHDYYRQVIIQAQSAVKMHIDEREFQCFSIGMKKENLVKVKHLLRKTHNEIADFYDEDGDHVFQFNLSGFPLAEL
jgi:uncharacterized protein (TIGR02147 family)